MKEKPLISVIIPNYNHARYLDERIQSVLNQTYKDFEVIILDDKSTDNSVEVINKYKGNPHISHIVLNKENSGSTFKQWQKGFALAKGDFIWIAESDDSCDCALLERLANTIEENIVIAYSRSLQIDEYGNKTPYHLQDFVIKQDFQMKGDQYIKKYLTRNNYISNASSAIFKKEIAISINPQYIEMKGEGDWFFWMEMLEFGDIAFINNPLNFFRQHHSNTTQKLRYNGTSFIEHKKTFDYWVDKKYITGVDAFKKRMFYIKKYKDLNYVDYSAKMKVLNTWDKYHIYRILYPLYQFLLSIKYFKFDL